MVITRNCAGVITYRYTIGNDCMMKFHTLAEVGQPYQCQARRIIRRYGWRVQFGADLNCAPWVADVVTATRGGHIASSRYPAGSRAVFLISWKGIAIMRSVDNGQDILDSRDVIKRCEELQAERDALQSELDDAAAEWSDARGAAEDELADWDCEYGRELAALNRLCDEGERTADWVHGETLIRDTYFETYARELAEDIGALENCNHWPATCIDWERAAHELQADYFTVDFDGVDYWVRA